MKPDSERYRVFYTGIFRICGYRLAFLHAAPSTFIPPVIPMQTYPRKPWKRGRFPFQEPQGSLAMAESVGLRKVSPM